MASIPDRTRTLRDLPLRRLVILFDGTWSKAETQTNVERLWKLIAASDTSGREQVSEYLAGVGVEPGLGHLLGGAFGRGLAGSVKQGYQWLAQHWRDDDEVWLFGFSRGAYAARSVSGLIHKCGLLKPDANGQVTSAAVDAAYALYEKNTAYDDPQTAAFRARYSREIGIHFIGVWETVGELGIPDVASWFPYARNRYRFHDTELSGNVSHAYQALALDEHRADFMPAKWTSLPASAAPIAVEQRWFIGAHSDVGGGEMADGAGRHPDPLPDITLAWMQRKAIDAGLAFNQTFVPAPDAYTATPNDSYRQFMYGLYHLFKRPCNRVIGGGVNETIDDSVWRRWREVADYRPPSLLIAVQTGVVIAPPDIQQIA
ncbi:MAG: DUF2235 domain-containing protein [Rhodanobacteraceae bacterium]